MRRKLLLLMAMLMVTVPITQPYEGQALSEIEKIDQELKALKNEMERAAHNQRYADKTVEEITGKKKATAEDIVKILAQIDDMQTKLNENELEIATAENELFETTQELEDANKQLNNRKELMDTRVRMAYTTGAVSYLDVLLSSSSFTDFLGRYDAVESIVTQDRDIADQKQKYSEEVTAKKAQKEKEKKDLELLYAKRAKKMADMVQKERDKEVMMSNYDKQIEESEEISEEAANQLTELAKKASALEAKKNRIKNYYKGGKLGMPLKSDYRLSSPFGFRIHPITGKKKLHAGMDMAAPKGTPVYAAETGVVTVAQSWHGYGNCIVIDHGGGLWTLYGHLSVIQVKQGETVKRGEKIGLVGSTGQSTGNHLHFEVRKNAEPVNPAPYLK